MRARYWNVLSAIGAALTTVGAVLFLVFFAMDLAGVPTSPYLGIVTFVLLPAIFLLGLLLIPIGFWRARRRVAQGRAVPQWPMLDFGRPGVRRAALLVLALTTVNVAIASMAAYKTVEYTDSTAFCTGVCHEPMAPEAAGHQRAVHASISCASCHVGHGPAGFVRAKLGGVHRLTAVLTGSVSTPIPVPVHDLPDTAATCQSCHTASRRVGDVVRALRSYADDETSTETVTALRLHVGGGGAEARGIHWHASPQTRLEYITTDASRETIPWIRVTDGRGTREFAVDGVTPEQLAAGTRRTMDCTDCHNRAGHGVAATPEQAVDLAIAQADLPRELPFIRREAVAALKGEPEGPSSASAVDRRLRDFYAGRTDAPAPRVEQAATAARRLLDANVFPTMRVAWGTYPSHLGHTDSPGCFRCHDDLHKARDGAAVPQDCETCHAIE